MQLFKPVDMLVASCAALMLLTYIKPIHGSHGMHKENDSDETSNRFGIALRFLWGRGGFIVEHNDYYYDNASFWSVMVHE